MHISRIYNIEADNLSKEVVKCDVGILFYQEYVGGVIIQEGSEGLG